MSRTTDLIKRIDAKHEWKDNEPRSSGGTTLYMNGKCPICGLERHYFSDTQNGNDGQTTYTLKGQKLTLKEALNIQCEEQ